MEKKDWRRIKDRCLRATRPSKPILTKNMHRMIAAYNQSVEHNQDSEQAEEMEGR